MSEKVKVTNCRFVDTPLFDVDLAKWIKRTILFGDIASMRGVALGCIDYCEFNSKERLYGAKGFGEMYNERNADDKMSSKSARYFAFDYSKSVIKQTLIARLSELGFELEWREEE